MDDDRLKDTIATTVQNMLEDESTSIAVGPGRIPADERIAEPDPAAYVAPSYLQETAPDLEPAFRELLAMLLELNRRFAGETTLEAQASLSLTGEHESLEEFFLTWSIKYFDFRGRKDRLSYHVNGNDRFRLFLQCIDEFDRLIGYRILVQGTINSSVLNLSQRYMYSRFPLKILDSNFWNSPQGASSSVSTGHIRLQFSKSINSFQRGVIIFEEFVSKVLADLPEKYQPNDSIEWVASLKRSVTDLANGMNSLREVLTYQRIHTAKWLKIGGELFARISWDVYHGSAVAAILTSNDSDDTNHCRTTRHPLAFRRDGWICHREYSWIRVDPDYKSEERLSELAANWYLLDLLTFPLYEAWDQLDLRTAIHQGLTAGATDDEQTTALAISAIDFETLSATTSPAKNRPLPIHRLSRIKAIFSRLGIEWSMGKGSEQKFYRPGGRLVCFGCHGADRQVFSRDLKRWLRKLDVPLDVFVAECQR
jgi:hypothetical protein